MSSTQCAKLITIDTDPAPKPCMLLYCCGVNSCMSFNEKCVAICYVYLKLPESVANCVPSSFARNFS